MTEPAALGREIFLCRELSWLNFNSRVLDEAGCPANPLLERLKFIAIFSSNLDEFFMVRVAGLRQLVQVGEDQPDPAGLRPSEQLALLHRKIKRLLRRQSQYLQKMLLPELEQYGVRLTKPSELPAAARDNLKIFFNQQVLPVLTPIAVDPSHPFPMLNSGAIEIAVSLESPELSGTVFAFVEVPEGLPRFIEIPEQEPQKQTFVLLEDLIMDNLQSLFAGCRIREFFPFRITRDMDFAMEEEGVEDLLHTIERSLLQRRRREPIRLEKPGNLRGELADWLNEQFQLAPQFRYAVSGPLHLKQFFELAGKVRRPELLEAPWPGLVPAALNQPGSMFKLIGEAWPVMLAVPFHKFEPVIRLLEEAANDPQVLAIKQTLYRVSGNSPVVRALQRAAENGKQVTVIVELKARFDEGNNIIWARRLEESGAHVVYGISGLKIHCKALLIVRREEGLIRRYVHLATGNYNDKTAALYTDLGIFSCDPLLCSDVANLFNVMTGYSAPFGEWQKIAAAPFDLRRKFIALIDREARLSTAENPGRIIAKMNGLVDAEIIRHLYAAAYAGVKIDLIVRGICCLKPGVGTENIRVISIVDRYLEHSRIFYFRNNGNAEYYLSSADWMVRNLDRRIELLFPIEDARLQRILMDVLKIQLNDHEKARRLLGNGNYTRLLPPKHTASRSQYNTYQYFKALAQNESHSPLTELKVFTSDDKTGEE